MGMPARSSRHWTRKEVLALPDDGMRYELVDGELLVSPSPGSRHQVSLSALFAELLPYVRQHRLGQLLWSPADLDLGAGHLVQPDIFLLRDLAGLVGAGWQGAGVPLLVVETLSPSTARHDRIIKRQLYQRVGVSTCWIVDLEARLVEIWTPDDVSPRIVTDTLTWQPRPELPPLEIDLEETLGVTWKVNPIS